MMRVVIKSSIRNKMRTKEDWENFRREKKAIEKGNVMESCIEELEPVNEVITEMPTNTEQPLCLQDYLLGDKETLLESLHSTLAPIWQGCILHCRKNSF